MNLQPLEDRIVVRPAEAEETTISGLVIPDTAKEKPQQGEVLAVGPGPAAENSGELIADRAHGRRHRRLLEVRRHRDHRRRRGRADPQLARRARQGRQEPRRRSSDPRSNGVRHGRPARAARFAFGIRGRGLCLGPLVVGLAVRAAHDLGHEHEPARALVARERLERGGRARSAVSGRRPVGTRRPR